MMESCQTRGRCQEQRLSQNQRPSKERWLEQRRCRNQGQRRSWDKLLSRGRRLDQWRCLSQEQKVSQDPYLNQSVQLSLNPQLNQGKRPSQERWMTGEEPLKQAEQLNHEQQLGPENGLRKERRIREHQQLMSIMPARMSKVAIQVKEFKTFDEAAFLFSLDEWNEWKELEGWFQKPVMKPDSVRRVVQGSGQTHETNLLKCYDSGNGIKSETGRTAQSPNLSTKANIKYEEIEAKKLPPDKIQSIKEGLKKLLHANRKTPSTLHSLPATPPSLPVRTGSEAYASSAATPDLAEGREQSECKRPTICYDCGKIFFSPARFLRHQEMHRALKPYHCIECGEPFLSQMLLLRHQVSHPGLKPHSCTECGKLFSSQDLLILHQKMHRVPKPYDCTECGKHLISQELLLKHHEMHRLLKPYNCTDSGKIFSEVLLLGHQEMHCAAKPYTCTECGKSFKTKSRFQYHRSTHTGVRAFECSECGLCFNRKGLLLLHYRNHSGKRATTGAIPHLTKGIELNICSDDETYGLSENKIPGSVKQIRCQVAYAGKRLFACTKCEKKFSSGHFLKMHREKIHGEPHKSLSKQKKKLLLKLKLVRRRADSTVESSASWQWTIVHDENIMGRENP